MPLTVFTQRNFVADFLQENCDYRGKTAVLLFLATLLGDLGATYDDHLRLVGKRVGDFLLVLIELFSLDRMAEALRAIIDTHYNFKDAVFHATCQVAPASTDYRLAQRWAESAILSLLLYLSSVLSKFSHKNNFRSGVTPLQKKTNAE